MLLMEGTMKYLLAILLLLMALLAVFILFMVYRHRLRRREHARRVEGLRRGQEQALLQSQLEIQERTFQHIAREIHDNIGQKLTLAKFQLSTGPEAAQEAATGLLTDCHSLIAEALTGLKQLSNTMNADTLLDNGIIKAIEAELRRVDKINGYSTSLNITGREYFLDRERELILFRIAQECITNILRHAFATQINVDAHFNSNHLQLDISDNGKGFDAGKGQQGTGLSNIRSRVALLNGQCKISSNDAGTLVQLRIPYHDSRQDPIPAENRQHFCKR